MLEMCCEDSYEYCAFDKRNDFLEKIIGHLEKIGASLKDQSDFFESCIKSGYHLAFGGGGDQVSVLELVASEIPILLSECGRGRIDRGR